MSTRHPHAQLIIAWANGAEIEFKRPEENDNCWSSAWSPTWAHNNQYRIKQVPSSCSCVCNKVASKPKIKRWLWMHKSSVATSWTQSNIFMTEEEFSHWCAWQGKKLPWSEMEFDE
jgi:hypothetical protein